MGIYSSTMTIEELIDGSPGRLLLLSGAGLPLQGAAWGGENGIITTWYPGNGAEGTQQVLGPKEAPSQWSGEWHRTTLPDSGCLFVDENGTPTSINTPFFLCNTLEDILRTGHRLRVTWSVQGTAPDEFGTLTREGRAKSWSFPFERLQDIHWDITYEWVSRGEKQRPVSTRDENVVSASNDVSAALAQAILKAKALNIHNSLPTSFSLGQLDALAGYPNALVKGVTRSLQRVINQFAQVAGIVSKLKSLPFAMANTVVDFAHNNVALSKQFTDELGRQPIELLTLKSKSSDVARAGRLFFATSDAVELAARRSQELEDKFRKVVAQARQMAALTSRERSSRADEGDLLAVHVTKDGDTPERLSMKYYKNGDRGLDILRANKLPYHQPRFKPGIALIIPRLTTSQSAG